MQVLNLIAGIGILEFGMRFPFLLPGWVGSFQCLWFITQTPKNWDQLQILFFLFAMHCLFSLPQNKSLAFRIFLSNSLLNIAEFLWIWPWWEIMWEITGMSGKQNQNIVETWAKHRNCFVNSAFHAFQKFRKHVIDMIFLNLMVFPAVRW